MSRSCPVSLDQFTRSCISSRRSYRRASTWRCSVGFENWFGADFPVWRRQITFIYVPGLTIMTFTHPTQWKRKFLYEKRKPCLCILLFDLFLQNCGQVSFRAMYWTPAAEEHLNEVPFVVRRIVKKGVEKKALICNKNEVDDLFYLEVKASRGR